MQESRTTQGIGSAEARSKMTAARYPCPHCGLRTISWGRKLFMGPATNVRCAACGGEVGVPWFSFWVALGFGILVVFGLRWANSIADIVSRVLMSFAIVILVGGFSFAWVRWIPLEKR